MIAALVIFWFCILAIAHSYVIYPVILQVIISFKGEKKINSFSGDDILPSVSILLAAYNEELVIGQKIRSIFDTDYPIGKIEVWVGSDNSTDMTNEIVTNLCNNFPGLHFINFDSRQGKIGVINSLFEKATGSILIITDANVMLNRTTLSQLVKYFGDDRVGLVDTHMNNYGLKKNGISVQEKTYISREVYVKSLESRSFGAMIGPFGGCYAIRKELFEKIPSNFLVDDFFICMNVLSKGKYTLNNLNANVFEDVSNNLSIEFKRKIRIAAGDFQNLNYFKHLLWPPYNPIAFCFFSHKVLRWFGPFLLIGAFLANLILASASDFFLVLLLLQLTLSILPFIDFFLKKLKLHVVFLRFITHFYTMNLSLLIGFIKSIIGIRSNVWKPTRRLQE